MPAQAREHARASGHGQDDGEAAGEPQPGREDGREVVQRDLDEEVARTPERREQDHAERWRKALHRAARYRSGVRIYADHAATTPVSDEAWEAMQPYLREHFGNASEPHWAGRDARRGLDAARAAAAGALGVEPADVVFTGGASEADNIAILGRAARGPGASSRRRSSIPRCSGAVEALERRAARSSRSPVDADGRVPVGALDEAVRPGDLVCSLIWASNLTGVIQPVAEAAAICAERGVPLHLDAVQACPALDGRHRRAAGGGHRRRRRPQAGRAEGRGAALRPRPRDARAGALRRRPGARVAAGHRERRAGGRPGGGARGRPRDSGRYARYRAVRDAYEAALAAQRGRASTIVGEHAERTPGHSLALLEGVNGHALVALLDERGVAAAAGPGLRERRVGASPR